uniref:Uncharacterized protein n=1 Tax=Peronospora matthiolae TaxID=2874970 RepID=A0AAV1THW4_9STRA
MVRSAACSLEAKRMGVLMENFGRATGLRAKESKEMIETTLDSRRVCLASMARPSRT